MRHARRIAAMLAACALLVPAAAEVVQIPVGQQGARVSVADRPPRGMKQSDVLTRFGEPESRAAPVGVPPISRWQYENFSVYFEHDTVLHSVLRHVPTQP